MFIHTYIHIVTPLIPEGEMSTLWLVMPLWWSRGGAYCHIPCTFLNSVLLLGKFRKSEKSNTLPDPGIEPETPCRTCDHSTKEASLTANRKLLKANPPLTSVTGNHHGVQCVKLSFWWWNIESKDIIETNV
ncbi:hypothetical protein SFRURICE_013903 [Spodoptera frugiperda]|uniref:SFRICE_025831 n=1 Tax=Spodoptera frugiperda TaxID=7108 RepID=A0A2H1W0D0_SPOFR|nr:hypothetical protein SFRURICE_013903 [Spodoptera frugiperda]